MILVTGATGLLGSHLIKQLSAQGKQIKALYRTTIPTGFPGNIQWVKGDILDILSLQEAMQQVQQVYHCAASVSFNPKKRTVLHKTNINGTANIVNACIDNNIHKLLFVSSVAALGRIREDVSITEQMKWTEETSNSEYGKTKYLAELEIWRGIGEGLQAVVVNPTIILGSGDWNSGSTKIFKTAYEEFPWYTNGISGFVDVMDVVQAMIILMDSNINNERFIVSGHNIEYKQLFSFIAKNFNKKPPHKLVSKWMAQIIWRIEAIKGKMTAAEPLLTKETAKTAQAKVRFDNSKLLTLIPGFSYTPLEVTIQRVCAELKQRYNL